ncbi:protein fuzzy homolog isoform X1 [Monodelphis domestica]|uniref:protein fuzzy homolog isoform X1 n=1 Tax=Monodelphis domestica TaxID=13616 RepID=UPI0004431280|nr:protein fuzzy homolog isoform X1 [Monodelphis domestica]
MAEESTEGAVHLLCLTTSSGVPLFCRSSRGGAPSRQQLPFSIIGSLNGVHMFGANMDVTLRSARTKDTAVVWKTFHDSISLIVLSSEQGSPELRLERLLELVFGAMVLLVGLEELTQIRNVERLKKDLRATYGLIDSLLLDSELMGDLTQCVDCIAPPDGPLLQEALAGIAEEMGSVFASLVARGRVVAATQGWWRLGAPESVLLPWLVGTLPVQAARDYPVYLPHGSPTVPHRLLTLMLLPGLDLCMLCGPQPPLSQVEPQVLERWWQPVLEPLRACLALVPRGLPAGFPVHPDILGRLLLLHLEQRRGLFTVELGGVEGPSPRSRRRLLRSFYVLVTSSYFPPEAGSLEEKAEEQGGPAEVARACYVVSEAAEGPGGRGNPGAGLRLVAVQAGPRRLLLLVSPRSPAHGLRGLATRTLHALTPIL